MEKSINVKSVYDSIDEVNMSSAKKAWAKGRMHDAEAVADRILWVAQGRARLGRAALNLGRNATAHMLREGN